jgi:hypothetical protein
MKNDRIKNDRIKSDRIKSGCIKSDRIKTDRIKRITDPYTTPHQIMPVYLVEKYFSYPHWNKFHVENS